MNLAEAFIDELEKQAGMWDAIKGGAKAVGRTALKLAPVAAAGAGYFGGLGMLPGLGVGMDSIGRYMIPGMTASLAMQGAGSATNAIASKMQGRPQGQAPHPMASAASGTGMAGGHALYDQLQQHGAQQAQRGPA